MLVLSRKRNERIIVTDRRTGDRLTIAVVDIRGDKARIGLEASDDYAIHREEVQDQIDAGDRGRPAA